MNDQITDYLGVGDVILARLKDLLPEVPSSLQIFPSIFPEPTEPLSLIVTIEDCGGVSSAAKSLKVTQKWCVLVVPKMPHPDFGRTITRVIVALHEWKPPEGSFTPLKHSEAGHKPHSTNSDIVYFPVAFTTDLIFKANGG